MLDVKDILSLEFYKKSPFFGSLQGIRYKIEKIEDEEGNKQLECIIWPEPYGFDATEDSLKESTYYTFDDQGLADVTAYLNEQANQQA